MTIDTWVSVGALLAVLVTLGGLVLGQGRALHRDIEGLRAELKSDIGRLGDKVDGLRTELKGDIGRLDDKVDGLRTELQGDIARLDDRVYALAAGLRPQVEHAQTRPAAE